MKNIRKFVCLLILATLVSLTASAQVDEEMFDGEIDLKPIDFSNFPSMSSPKDLGFKLLMPTETDTPLFIYHTGKYQELQPRANNLSALHYYNGASPLTIFKEDVDEEGKPIFVPVASAKFSPTTQDAIVYLQNQGEQYRAFLIDISLKAQELGSARFINLTPANLAVLLSEDRATLAPGEAVTTSFDTEKKNHFKFKVAARDKEEAQLIFSKRYPFRGEMRMLFIGYSSKPSSAEERPFRVLTHRDAGPEPRAQ